RPLRSWSLRDSERAALRRRHRVAVHDAEMVGAPVDDGERRVERHALRIAVERPGERHLAVTAAVRARTRADDDVVVEEAARGPERAEVERQAEASPDVGAPADV